jgi:hypothetical protein
LISQSWLVAPCAPFTPLCSCSCMSLSSSGLTRVFQWWGGVRSTQQSQTPSQPGTTLHSWGDVWYIRQFWPDTHSWLVMLVYQKMMCLSPWTWGDVWYIHQFWPDTHSWLVMLVYQKMMCLSPWTQKN